MEMCDKIAGGFYGLLIGDALGVPYEFCKAEQLPPYEKIDMIPPLDFKKTYPQVEAGTWSDDGAQALCLLDSLISQGGFSLNSFSDLLSAWYEDGLWAVNNVVFDVGIQTGNGVLAWDSGNTKRLAFHAAGEGQGRKIAGTVLFKPWVYLRFFRNKMSPCR